MEKAKSEGLNLLKTLNILQKKDEVVRNLSGGMKRKLSLSVALIGSPEVNFSITYYNVNLKYTCCIIYNINNLLIDINLR